MLFAGVLLGCGVTVGIALIFGGFHRPQGGDAPSASGASHLESAARRARLKVMRRGVRGLQEMVDLIGAAAKKRSIASQGGTAAARDHAQETLGGSQPSIEELISRYKTASPGTARTELLDQIMVRVQGAATPSKLSWRPVYLKFFRQVVHDPTSSARERFKAAIVTHPIARYGLKGILAYDEDLLRSEDREVRAKATEGLGWIQGPERQAAHGRLRELIRDADPKVRRTASVALAILVGDASDVPLLVRQLIKETDLKTARQLIDDLEKLDPKGFHERLRSLVGKVQAVTRPLVKRRLSSKDG